MTKLLTALVWIGNILEFQIQFKCQQKMSSFTPASKYSELVESDMESILKKVMHNVNLLDHYSGVIKSQPITLKSISTQAESSKSTKSIRQEIQSLLADDLDKNIDETWDRILNDAKKDFEKEQEFRWVCFKTFHFRV